MSSNNLNESLVSFVSTIFIKKIVLHDCKSCKLTSSNIKDCISDKTGSFGIVKIYAFSNSVLILSNGQMVCPCLYKTLATFSRQVGVGINTSHGGRFNIHHVDPSVITTIIYNNLDLLM